MYQPAFFKKQPAFRWGLSRLLRSRLSWGVLIVAGLMILLATPASAVWPNLPYGTDPGQWNTINELLGTAANYDFASGQKMTINGRVCGNVANASSVNGNGLYSKTGIVYGSEWVGATGPIHSTYTSQSFGCQWYTPTSGFPVGALPACDTTDPKNEPSDQLFMDMAIASNTAKDLTPTQTFASIDTVAGDVTINVVSGLNVINIPADPVNGSNGNLTVRGAGNLIINGPADAVVIFNVGSDDEVNTISGGMDVNGSSILVTGGVQAQNVFFNVLAGDVTANGGSNAPGEVINGSLIVRAGSDVKAKFTGQGYMRVNGSVLGDGIHSSEFSIAANTLICKQADRGDAPDAGAGAAAGNYNTLTTDNGPFHVMIPTLKLGAATDREPEAQPTLDATGDDNQPTAGPDDEDGVIAPNPLSFTPNSNPTITVQATNTTGAAAFLRCWVDLNGDGDFLDAGEASGSGATTVPTGGTANFDLTFGTLLTADTTYLRCRLSSVAAGVASPVGPATSSSADPLYLGEIEDYAVQSLPGVIGNFVWVDENEDGYQDAGEPGLGGVTVELRNSSGVLLATRVTDTNGGYLFTKVGPGSYTVQVDASSLPAGMHQTTNPINAGADFGNQSQPYTINLAAGAANLTADFGYVWGNPDGNNDLGAIGDRVWIDSNGDGAQDAGEAGLGGVQVKIYFDSNSDGVVDPAVDAVFGSAQDQNGAPGGVTTTEADGSYIFSALPAGLYVVVVTPPAGYTQTGDPDEFGAVATNPDNRTTSPVVLAPGDVFLNVDFGYQPTTGDANSIGDRVWFDDNADGVQDATEMGIAGVSLSLLNSSGVGIATAVTDANGSYLFSGLPDGSYSVKVTDTANILVNLTQSGDPDGVFDGMGTVLDLGVGDPNPVANLDQDFGYTPLGQQNGEGLIGNTIFLNTNGDNAQDAGEPGLGGVVVNLLDSGGAFVASTKTNSNGHYYFGNLNPLASYTVVVAPENFAAGGVLEGLDNTADPDGGNDSQAIANLGAPGSDGNADEDGVDNGINLGQDFGYTPPAGQIGRIGNLIWRDTNANGVYEAGLGETPIGGVTVDLFRDLNGNGRVDSGEPLFGQTTSAASIISGTYGIDGNYIFDGVPAGNYVVKVSDAAGILLGNWHSLGAAGSDNNSQIDPYAVSIGNGNPLDNLTADFGYYVEPAAIGDFVWSDLDNNGLQDGGEPGIAGVEVALTISYTNGDVSVLTTLTGADGSYSFNNLLMDEDYDGVGAGEPIFTVTSAIPGGFNLSPINVGADDAIDSDDPISGEMAELTRGGSDNTNDFGFTPRYGAIGNYVWVDENADGNQDVGEPGLPDVTVQLFDSNGNLADQQTTDVAGGYLFRANPGVYTVQVDPSTLPFGMAQTTNPVNPGADFGNQSQPYAVTVVAGGENLTADFGYAWGSQNGNGAIGDYVWVDADGNGLQNPGEPGLGGVPVTIYYDSNGDKVVDPNTDSPYPGALDLHGIPGGATTTEPNGRYIFSDLPLGQYVVVVTPPADYVQTGDPDELGQTATSPDNRTTSPIVLATGDVYLRADFGYQPGPNNPNNNTIGDRVWFDVDADGIQIPGEDGIAGVKLVLLNAGGKAIALDITDANGDYLFVGLPDGTYTVRVTDTDNVLSGLYQSGDPDGIPNGMGVVVDLGVGDPNPVSDLNQDFGYAPFLPGNSLRRGVIGDTIFLNPNGNATQDADEPGLEGVFLQLYDTTDGALLATTRTDENGVYHFGGLLADNRTYLVVVAPQNFVAGGVLQGLANTADPNGGNDNSAAITLTHLSPVSLDQDFGYTPLAGQMRRIGNLMWRDSNANGVNEPALGETPIGGVTVEIYRDLNGSGTIDPDEPRFGNTTTSATVDASRFGINGNYIFTGLPAGKYVVNLTDEAGVLTDYVFSAGDQAGTSDGTSKIAPYAVDATMTDRLEVDFGSFSPFVAGIGDFVWDDLNRDGIQQVGEPGIPGVTVTLQINYPSGSVVTLVTRTDSNGRYRFDNLLQGAGLVEPTFVITFTPLPDMIPSPAGQGGDSTLDSNGTSDTPTVTQGQINNSVDSGFYASPTAVSLRNVETVSAEFFSPPLLFALVALPVAYFIYRRRRP